MKIAIPDMISNSYFPVAAAVELGFFKAEGLDMQLELIFPVNRTLEILRDGGIDFVGGIRGTAELEKLVNSGEYACAFSMFPTSIEDLMQIADAGGIMPPKSTWFEPKLRDAMFCHMI